MEQTGCAAPARPLVFCNRLLRIDEVAKEYNMAERTIQHLAFIGEIKAVKVGAAGHGRYLIPRHEMEGYCRRKLTGNEAEEEG